MNFDGNNTLKTIDENPYSQDNNFSSKNYDLPSGVVDAAISSSDDQIFTNCTPDFLAVYQTKT